MPTTVDIANFIRAATDRSLVVKMDARAAFLNATQDMTFPRNWVIVEVPARYGPQVKGEKHWSSVSAVLRLSARLAVNDTLTVKLTVA